MSKLEQTLGNPGQTLDVTIGPLAPAEMNLVMSSWKKSQRSRYRLPTSVYYAWISAEIERVMADFPEILCARIGPTCVGWVCFAPGVLHYLYVKSPYRRNRVAARLYEASGLERGAVYNMRLWDDLVPVMGRYGLVPLVPP